MADLERRVAELERWRDDLLAGSAARPDLEEGEAGDHPTEAERRARQMGPGG